MAKLNISKDEYERLRRLGLSEQQIVQKYSAGPSTFDKITAGASKVANATGFKGTVDVLSTKLAKSGAAARGMINAPGALLGHQPSQDRYNQAKSTFENLPKTTFKQDLGAAAQVGSLVAGAAPAAASFLPRLAANTALGATALAGQAAAENKDGSTILQQGLRGGIFSALVTSAMAGAGKVAEGVYKAFIPRNEREARLLTIYKADKPLFQRLKDIATGSSTKPITSADTSFKKGLAGPESWMGVQARRASNTLWDDMIDPALKGSKTQVDVPKFLAGVRQEIIKQNPEPTRQNALLAAFDELSDDYKNIKTATLPQLQEFKEGWAQFLPKKAYLGEDIAAAGKEIRDSLADASRQFIYKELGPGVREAYIDYGNLKNLEKLGVEAMKGRILQPGGAQSFVNSLAETVMVPITTTAGLTVYKLANGLEIIAKPGLHTLGQFILDATSSATQQPYTSPTQLPTKTETSSSPDATTSGIKVKGPFSGKEFEISPGGPALSARMAITPKAMTTLKTALQKALEVHTKTPKLEIAEEAANLSDMLRTLKGPLDQANFRRIIEVLKLQGKKVQPFLDYVNKHTQ